MPNNFKITANHDEAEWFIAMRKTNPLYLPDNHIGYCVKCRLAIQFRPDVPTHLKKICFECAEPRVREMYKRGQLELRLMPQHAAEFREFLRKKNGRRS